MPFSPMQFDSRLKLYFVNALNQCSFQADCLSLDRVLGGLGTLIYWFQNTLLQLITFLPFSSLFTQAQREDELDISSDDELEVLEWDDGDGWCKGRNKQGKEGYFPQSYVRAVSRPPSPSISDMSSTRRTSSLVSDALSMNSDFKRNDSAGAEVVKNNG